MAFAVCILCLSAADANAQMSPQGILLNNNADDDSFSSPLRGIFIYGHRVNLNTFSPDAEPNYNPRYVMTGVFAPMWMFDDVFSAGMNFSLSREITNSDWTTDDGATIPGDFGLSVSANNFLTIPYAEIGISSDLSATLPIHPASVATSMIMSTTLGLSFFRQFKVFNGIFLFYGINGTFTPHRYTTGGNEEPSIANCSGVECSRFENTGSRNAPLGLSHSFGLNVGLTSYVSFRANFGIQSNYLYETTDITEGEGLGIDKYSPQEAIDTRYMFNYNVGLILRPGGPFMISTGVSTANPQLSPNSTYYAPFVNRNSNIYVNIGLNLGQSIDMLMR